MNPIRRQQHIIGLKEFLTALEQCFDYGNRFNDDGQLPITESEYIALCVMRLRVTLELLKLEKGEI